MSEITDLTGTTWVFNDSFINEIPSSDEYHEYFVNFTCNNTSYILMDYGEYEDEGAELRYVDINNNWITVYSGIGNAWTDNIYKTITITGGDDVTNENLINFLEDNATQIIEEEPISSFNELEVIDHTDYITLTIQGNTINVAKGITSNFELSNGDILELSNGDIFETQ